MCVLYTRPDIMRKRDLIISGLEYKWHYTQFMSIIIEGDAN